MNALYISILMSTARLPDSVQSRTTSDQRLDRRIQAFESHFDEANRLAGVLLIARGDEIILHRAYGQAAPGVRNELDTRICIASITKIMTQIVLAQSLGERKLAVSDPIATWLTDFPRGDSITIEHLARHRAGIPHRVTTAEDELLPLGTADIVQRAAKTPLIVEPGGASNYSSAGYTLLARCLELAENKTFSQILEERVFQPAGMSSTIDPPPGGKFDRRAASFVPGRGKLLPAPQKDLAFLAGAGSVFSTASDLLKFLQALRDGKLRVPLEALVTGDRVAWTGASNGFFAFLDTYPNDDLTCIWLGNSWGGCSSALRTALPDLIAGKTVKPAERPPLAAATLSADALAEFAGNYQSRAGAFSEARVADGELWFADSMLLQIAKDRFWHQPWHCEVHFVRDESGKVAAFERDEAGATTRWPKK